ncbi:hypothetical protein VW603_000008 [Salmonella enterica]|nr:hypothetical protein [Salmonella enterica]
MKKRCRQPENLRERCRHIFGDEPPVRHVWEPEFDYADAELQALAATDCGKLRIGILAFIMC